jgi:hypothetical protein
MVATTSQVDEPARKLILFGLQHAPSRGKTGTDSSYERGQIGEQVTSIVRTAP